MCWTPTARGNRIGPLEVLQRQQEDSRGQSDRVVRLCPAGNLPLPAFPGSLIRPALRRAAAQVSRSFVFPARGLIFQLCLRPRRESAHCAARLTRGFDPYWDAQRLSPQAGQAVAPRALEPWFEGRWRPSVCSWFSTADRLTPI